MDVKRVISCSTTCGCPRMTTNSDEDLKALEVMTYSD